MSETIIPTAQKAPRESDFPVRITTCIARDQAEALTAAKKRLHTSESQVVRLALDNFCAAVIPQNGAPSIK